MPVPSLSYFRHIILSGCHKPRDIAIMTLSWLYLLDKNFKYAKCLDKIHAYQRVRDRLYERDLLPQWSFWRSKGPLPVKAKLLHFAPPITKPQAKVGWVFGFFLFFFGLEVAYTTCVCCFQQNIWCSIKYEVESRWREGSATAPNWSHVGLCSCRSKGTQSVCGSSECWGTTWQAPLGILGASSALEQSHVFFRQ